MDSQTVDDGATLSTLPLPVVNLSQKAEEGFLGVGHIAVWGPAQELEMTHHKLAFLKLKRKSSREGGKSLKSYFLPIYSIKHALNPSLMLHTSQTH